MDLGLTGRVVLVIGASKGIGRAIAAELAAEGAEVALTSRSLDRARETAGAIGAAAAFAWDTADHDGGPGLVAAVSAKLGGVDVLVCNTGGPPLYADSLAAPTDAWLDAYRSLVLAPMELVRAAVPGMRARGWGRVLNVVSSSAREPIPALVLSSAHRAAALATWKTLATEVAADGVTVNSLLPGRIDTDRLRETIDAPDRIAAEVPAQRLGRVEEMAAAAAFLCSDRAGYITGATLLVDGGLTKAI